MLIRFLLVFVIHFTFYFTSVAQIDEAILDSLNIDPQYLTDKKYSNFLNIFFQQLFDNGKPFNGAVLVAKKNKILYEKYYGWQDKEKNIRVNVNTSFHIASISKTFTSFAVMKLYETGKININDKIDKYLPILSFTDITIKDLLNHRSGLNTYDYFMDHYWKDKKTFISNNDVLVYTSIYTNQQIFSSNKRFMYSNTNYALLASLIESVTGMSYKKYMENNIFNSFGLLNTFVTSLNDTSICTPSYDNKFRKEPYTFLDFVVGDKGIYSTARDLLKWHIALSDTLILPNHLLEKMYQGYSNINQINTLDYGLGWRIMNNKKNKKIVFHYGWWHGNHSMFIRNLTDNITLVILSNKLDKRMYKAKLLFDRYDMNTLNE